MKQEEIAPLADTVAIAASGGATTPRRDLLLRLALVYGVSFVVSLVTLSLVLAVIGEDPVAALRRMFEVSLGSPEAIGQMLVKSTPLMLGGVAVALGMRAGFINLGIDGQIYAGAIAVVGLGIWFEGLPTVVAIPMLLGGSVICGIVAIAVPGLLRAFLGVSEIFTTVMMNFIIFYFAEYLATGPWNEPLSGEALTVAIDFSYRLPDFLTSAGHIGILIAVVAALGADVWVRRSRSGYELRAVGLNPLASQLSGINLKKIAIVALLVSGGIAGLAGGVEVTGVHGRMIMGMTSNYGFASVLVALLARQSPAAVVPISLAFGILLVGSDSLQRSANLPSGAVYMFVGIVVLTVLFLERKIGVAKAMT